jgi:alkanesulfonate monooxygenase SsuD/methylene tetrahydromethanopterin reductase-like flavin-dependent oxidoreductase (luciferase family)
MAGTLDTISGGRFELGIGAGWKKDEWTAYGYGFPPTKVRLAMLRDALEVISAMLAPGRSTHATFEGEHASVRDAINLPKGLQSPRIPLMVGGNGPEVTWRLAARFADELNLDGMSPDEVEAAVPVIRSRCEEIDRDPGSLRVSLHAWWGDDAWSQPGSVRVAYLQRLAGLGVDRVMGLLQASATSDEALDALAADVGAAGL